MCAEELAVQVGELTAVLDGAIGGLARAAVDDHVGMGGSRERELEVSEREVGVQADRLLQGLDDLRVGGRAGPGEVHAAQVVLEGGHGLDRLRREADPAPRRAGAQTR